MYTMRIHRFEINHGEQQALMWATKLPAKFHNTQNIWTQLVTREQIADCIKLIISILVVGGHYWISIDENLGRSPEGIQGFIWRQKSYRQNCHSYD